MTYKTSCVCLFFVSSVHFGHKSSELKEKQNCREKHGASLCGLSALMTTTVPHMEKTITLLRENCPNCKIMVGGAAAYTGTSAARRHTRERRRRGVKE